MSDRRFALLQSDDQWRRAAHQGTALLDGAVQLYWEADEAVWAEPDRPAPAPAGLAVDPWCRVYRSLPEQGQVERVAWLARDEDPPVPLFTPLRETKAATFRPVKEQTPLQQPGPLAVTEDGRLFVGETGTRSVLIYDLPERRLLRRVPLPDAAHALDMIAVRRQVEVLLDKPPYLLILDAWSDPRPDLRSEAAMASLFAESGRPSRFTRHPGGRHYLLVDGGTADARLLQDDEPPHPIAVPYATDIELLPGVDGDSDSTLIVARGIGQDFARFRLSPGNIMQAGDLKARAYDGRGIIRVPDGRIGYWTKRGLRHAVVARTRYLRRGRITTFRLDSGAFQTNWGRVFLDACIPRETDVRLHCLTADDPPEGPELARETPANIRQQTVHRPDLSPPMPPAALVPREGDPGRPLHPRGSGRELPWTRLDQRDGFRTYEAPVIAPAGRYLWITLELIGNSRFTPRIRSLRAEYPSHELLQRLPAVYARHDQFDFLRRYLALFDGLLSDLEGRAFQRRALLDPDSTPAELLPWLGSFVGMVVDRRFPEAARRRLVSEAVSLFRRRGTVPGLTRLLQIYLGVKPVIVEHFRLRGAGDASLRDRPESESSTVVGGGFRVGGEPGSGTGPEAEEHAGTTDAFRLHAHRFSVFVPQTLDDEQTQVVNDLLQLHRPAHTVVDVCTADAGMGVGRGLYVELTSIVGHPTRFGMIRPGHWRLGYHDTLGRTSAAGRLGSSRVGRDSVSG